MYLAYLWGTAIYHWIDEKSNLAWTILLGVLALYMILLLVRQLASKEGRLKLIVFFRKLTRIEFWPPIIFYLPLIPYLLWLILRYRSLTCYTAANPSIPASGIIGESKSDILKMLPKRLVAEYFTIRFTKNPKDFQSILKKIKAELSSRKWGLPFIIKPDQGQRGSGFRLIRKMNECSVFLKNYAHTDAKFIIQNYHHGPYELGVFYYRYPRNRQGKIFSVTDKKFPIIVGDGIHSLKQLIDAHPRYQLQRNVFYNRLGTDSSDVVPKKKKIQLAYAGNHCQGTMFVDGEHWITPKLTKRFNIICNKMRGFYFGRFDIRFHKYSDVLQGKNFRIIELNGATSESTNIYDPKFHFWQAYKILFQQWRIIFEIGAQNVARGESTTPLRVIIRKFLLYRLSEYNSIPKVSD